MPTLLLSNISSNLSSSPCSSSQGHTLWICLGENSYNVLITVNIPTLLSTSILQLKMPQYCRAYEDGLEQTADFIVTFWFIAPISGYTVCELLFDYYSWPVSIPWDWPTGWLSGADWNLAGNILRASLYWSAQQEVNETKPRCWTNLIWPPLLN